MSIKSLLIPNGRKVEAVEPVVALEGVGLPQIILAKSEIENLEIEPQVLFARSFRNCGHVVLLHQPAKSNLGSGLPVFLPYLLKDWLLAQPALR